jgi:hypothetical protein
MLVATFDKVSFFGRTDLDIVISDSIRRAHIEAKCPFDEIYHTNGNLKKEQLHVENEAIGRTASSSTVVGFMFDVFVMWIPGYHSVTKTESTTLIHIKLKLKPFCSVFCLLVN